MKKILCVVGTRPEAVKMAPIIKELAAEAYIKPIILATAQHRSLLDQVLELFDIKADYDLNIMQDGQTLSALTARLITAMDELILDVKPDAILAQGDTTTVMVSALTGFYHHIPFFHVEAGLRTFDLDNPFPEEANRIIAGKLCSMHFAPTEVARENLLRENTPENNIFITGNTVIDSLNYMQDYLKDSDRSVFEKKGKKLVLITVHRRENFGKPLDNIFSAIRELADRRSDLHFLYPVHPNPNVFGLAHEMLGGHENITLCEPLDYKSFTAALQASHIILTDSGGVQEEAPALSKPVLVLRKVTERPEAVDAGVVRIIGTEKDKIISEVIRLMDDDAHYLSMASGGSPYGDGRAAGRISMLIKEYFEAGCEVRQPVEFSPFEAEKRNNNAA